MENIDILQQLMAIFSCTFKQEKEQPLVTKVISAERIHAQEMIMFVFTLQVWTALTFSCGP